MVYRSSRIKISSGQVFWHEAGDSHRPVLVFLHGSWHDSSQWQEIMEPLSDSFHCIAVDLPGFGNSRTDRLPNSIAEQVDRLHEFLNAIQLSSHRVYAIGHSLGAWVAASYAIKYAQKIQGLVLISPEGFYLNMRQRYGFRTKFLLAHPLLLKSWSLGLKVATSISDGAAPLERKQAYWDYMEQFPTTSKLLFRRSKKEIASELVADKLTNFKIPLLILQPQLDDAVAIAQSQAYAKAIPHAEYRTIESIDDLPSLQQTIGEIQVFIERIQLKIDREEVEVW
jgi:pimeloyl-ACP methyl ester carboxylesterase